ncbi:GNAT family N-acetyltransferase [Chryseobacterium suipulveris]|uniref:GNAT family N-acetyltransferase n=1 Tax=Chryseobacterium suipulveris TaxID=2929800 RepID=A0ABY4BTU6_9FLAO|nr:GNAT family N-acetyltransferase [Chryseobacterium suipulveris]UOE40000.1 GNAT family N-acetyltransferase [Chryseobacterium suipulveris]
MENFLQPILENDQVKLVPLQENDFGRLYEVASDPKIWEMHPNKNRFEREVFRNFFEGAMLSGGAFLIIDKDSGEVAGSTRFYGWDEDESSVFIGYTFYGTKFWGSKLNPQVKKLMLDYIFQYVDLVKFHVGAENWRSRTAMERLGAENMGEISVAYHGEPDRQNVEYWIKKQDWITKQKLH